MSEGHPNISTTEVHTCPLCLYSNWLLHRAPCCLSMSLTYMTALSSRSRTQFIKTSAGTNLILSVWRFSYPAVTRNKTAGQRLAAGSRRSKCQDCDRKAKEMSEFVLLHFQSWYLHRRCSTALFHSSSSCRADRKAGRYDKGTWFHPLKIQYSTK